MNRSVRPAEVFDRIIVIVTRQIGDVLITTPLIHAARLRWPKARIDVLGFAGTLGMLRGNPDIGELIEVKEGASWGQSLPLIRRLWRRYDLALVAQYNDRAHLYGWITAPVRSGQVPADRKSWWKRGMLRHSVELGDNHSHVVIEKLRVLTPWVEVEGPQSVRPPPPTALPSDIRTQLRPIYIVLQVPSLVNFKQWPIRHYAELARELMLRKHQVVLTGGSAERDRALVAEVIAAIGSTEIVNATGRLDLNQMTTLLSGAALYIGPDTSITHLAASCGVPVIALYGPIDPKLWGPWPMAWPPEQPYQSHSVRQQRGNIVLLQGDQSCVPCNSAGCDRHRDSRSECLETMAPKRVLAEAMTILNEQSAA